MSKSARAGLELAAPAEVERLPIRAELADAMAASRAVLAVPAVHLHEAPVLFRLVVVGVGEDCLDGTVQDRRDGLVQRPLLREVQRGAAAERQKTRLAEDLVRIAVADAAEKGP